MQRNKLHGRKTSAIFLCENDEQGVLVTTPCLSAKRMNVLEAYFNSKSEYFSHRRAGQRDMLGQGKAE